jgi:group I intron endonuclease
MIIYKITNLLNGKIYVGKDAYDRNITDYSGSGVLIRKAINKYGIECFTKEVLENVSEDNWKECEIFWIKELKTQDPKIGYNIAEGGSGGNTWGHHTNDRKIEIKHLISTSLKGKERKPEHSAAISKAKIGKKIKDTSNMSDPKKGEKNGMYMNGEKVAGEKNGQYGKKGEKSSNWGKKHKPETIELMKKKARKGPRTDEEKKRMSDGIKKNMKYFIRQINRTTAEVIEDHLTVKDASVKTGIKYYKVYSNLDENYEFLRVYKSKTT